MKVALITPDLGLTGIPKYLELLALALPRVGDVHVEVICFQPPLDRLRTLESHGIPVHVLFPEGLSRSRLDFSRRLENLLASINPECVHTNIWIYNLFTSLTLYSLGMPEIITWHGLMERNHFIKLKYLKNTIKDILVTHLQQVFGANFISLGQHTRRPGVIRNRITNILHGVPSTNRVKIVKENNQYPLVIIQAARLIPGKGQRDLLEAISLLPSRDCVEVWLAGEGPDKSNLEKLAIIRSLENVKFLGWRSDIHDLLLRADIAVLPSYVDTFGFFIAESMMLGLPTVVYDFPAFRAICPPEGGILIKPGDIIALSQAIENLLKHAELRRAMGIAAHRWALKNFSDLAFAKKTLAVYQQACRQKSLKVTGQEVKHELFHT
jgi:glycosyltransferase involved in cell wall biosynthesis